MNLAASNTCLASLVPTDKFAFTASRASMQVQVAALNDCDAALCTGPSYDQLSDLTGLSAMIRRIFWPVRCS